MSNRARGRHRPTRSARTTHVHVCRGEVLSDLTGSLLVWSNSRWNVSLSRDVFAFPAAGECAFVGVHLDEMVGICGQLAEAESVSIRSLPNPQAWEVERWSDGRPSWHRDYVCGCSLMIGMVR